MKDLFPKKNIHMIDIGEPSETDWVLWASDVKSLDHYFDNSAKLGKPVQYSQLEFSKIYWRNCCTAYWPMVALSALIGRSLTVDERKAILDYRTSLSDFNPAVGGATNRGVDSVRTIWNKLHPDKPVVYFSFLHKDWSKKFIEKNIPVVTSFRGNSAFNEDYSDNGVINSVNFWRATYGHCRTRQGLEILDNYGTTKYWLSYRFSSLEQYFQLIDNGYEYSTWYVFFFEEDLSEEWKILVEARRLGYWNGERESDNLTRFEASRIALKIIWNNNFESHIWNGIDSNRSVTKYELSVMLNKWSNGTFGIYDWENKNSRITRREAILWLMKWAK